MDASPFARLPTELRLRIYEFSVAQNTHIEVQHNVDIKPDSDFAGTEDAFWAKYMRSLQPTVLEDTKVHLKNENNHPLGIAQTCKQMRREATGVFHSANTFWIDMDADYFYVDITGDEGFVNGCYYSPAQYPALTFPLVRLLQHFEQQCIHTKCDLPFVKAYLGFHSDFWTVGLREEINLHLEQALGNVMTTLLQLQRAYDVKGWDLDVQLLLRFGRSTESWYIGPLAYSSPTTFRISDGFKFWGEMAKEAEDAAVRFEDVRPASIDHNISLFRRWQTIFAP